jgi:hypothetical protein
MTAKKTLWQRWKRLAHKAAEIQAFVVLTIVYWLIVAPIGTMMKIGRGAPTGTGWKTRPPSGDVSIEEARRQS